MKKLVMFVFVLCSLVLFSVCANAATNFKLDFENAKNVDSSTINFNDANKDKIVIGPQAGFTGNAYKVSIMDQDNGKWFVTGMAINAKTSTAADFKNLQTVTFKYKSTVEFKKDKFIVQLVWKTTDAKKTEVAMLEVPFPVEKGSVKTFSITVPQAVREKLNANIKYNLDWVMIGLKDKSNEFRSGSFIVDDITFVKGAASAVKPTAARFTLDFEKPEIIGFKTINFNDANKDKIVIGPQTGFTGNAYKVSIMDQDGGKWFTTGIALDPKATATTANFKDLSKVTFKYKSTVEFLKDKFIVQLVWKTNDAKKTEVAKIEVPFPVEKGDVKTFSVTVPKEVRDILNTKSDYYLDWVMIGLKDKANSFRTGTFTVDDISFN